MEKQVHRTVAIDAIRIGDQVAETSGRQRKMIRRFANICMTGLEPLALNCNVDRHLGNPGQNALQVTGPIPRAVQDDQHDRRERRRQFVHQLLDVSEAFRA